MSYPPAAEGLKRSDWKVLSKDYFYLSGKTALTRSQDLPWQKKDPLHNHLNETCPCQKGGQVSLLTCPLRPNPALLGQASSPLPPALRPSHHHQHHPRLPAPRLEPGQEGAGGTMAGVQQPLLTGGTSQASQGCGHPRPCPALPAGSRQPARPQRGPSTPAPAALRRGSPDTQPPRGAPASTCPGPATRRAGSRPARPRPRSDPRAGPCRARAALGRARPQPQRPRRPGSTARSPPPPPRTRASAAAARPGLRSRRRRHDDPPPRGARPRPRPPAAARPLTFMSGHPSSEAAAQARGLR